MLNPNERDILREVGNIGAGHAATALSTLLGQPIEIEVPSAELEDFTTIIERSGGAETIDPDDHKGPNLDHPNDRP